MNSRRTSVALLYLQYDPGKHGADPGELEDVLGSLAGVSSYTIVVDNKRDGRREERGRRRAIIGGDNSRWEFSGWARGVEYLDRLGMDFDAVLFATDAYPVNYPQIKNSLRTGAVQLAIEQGLATGLLNFANRVKGALRYFMVRPEKYGLDGRVINSWLRSNFFLVPFGAVKVVAGLTVDRARYFPASLTDAVFLPAAPVAKNLRNMILSYLCPSRALSPLPSTWHSGFDLDGSTYTFFVAKATAILHEMSLMPALESQGYQTVDLRVLDLIKRLGGGRKAEARAAIMLARHLELQTAIVFHLRRLWKNR